MEKDPTLETKNVNKRVSKNKRDIYVIYFFIFILLGISFFGRRNTDNEIEKLNLKIDSLVQRIDSLNIGYFEESEKLRNKASKTGIRIPKSFSGKELQTVYNECKKYNIPPKIIFKIIKAESNFEPKSISKAGAKGYMQLMPKTYDAMLNELGLEEKNSINNLKAGIYYISKLYKRFKNHGQDTWHLAVISYNYGPTQVSASIDKFLSDEFRNHKYINKILN